MSLHIARSLLVAAMLAVAAPAWANVSRDEAAAVAQQVSNGRVLAVERAIAGDRPVWRVKVITPQGHVRVILVDLMTGRIL